MSETYDLYQQGRDHLKKGRAAQATVALEKAKRREPEKASIREALGIAYLRIQRYEEAEREFRAMLELSPADHYAHYGLGRALEKQGKQLEANGHYKLASSLRPDSNRYRARIREFE
jgi:Flp pilus assembly protein TadD